LNASGKALVLWFDDVRNIDVPVVGGKNASLGEMIHAGFQVHRLETVKVFTCEMILKKFYVVIKKSYRGQKF